MGRAARHSGRSQKKVVVMGLAGTEVVEVSLVAVRGKRRSVAVVAVAAAEVACSQPDRPPIQP